MVAKHSTGAGACKYAPSTPACTHEILHHSATARLLPSEQVRTRVLLPKLWRMPDGETPSTLSIHYRFHHPKQVHVLLAKAEADAWWKKLFNSIYLLQISPVPNQVHVLLAKAEADAWWETLLPPSQSTTTAPSRAGARAAGEGAGGRLVEEADGGRRGARLLRAAQRGSQCR